MNDQEDKINLGEIFFDNNNLKRNSSVCLGQTYSRTLIVFCPSFFKFFWLYLVAFEEFIFQKPMTKKLSGWDFCVVQHGTFYPQEDHEQVNFNKNFYLLIIGWSVRDVKVTIYLQLAQNLNSAMKIRQNWIFYQHFQPLYDFLQR